MTATPVAVPLHRALGVTDEERAKPQRLLVTLDMGVDFSSAIVSDRIERTINYMEVAEFVGSFGKNRNWRLLEKLAANIAGAKELGVAFASKAKAAGVNSVVFDRAGAPYHGKVKVFAEAAREGGLVF